jgi:hypothetical protein
MRWIITEPDGVEAALEQPDDRFGEEPKPSCLTMIRETPGFPQRERLDVYAEGYYSRIYSSLCDDYQAVQRWMGDDEFRSLVSDYLLEHPSRSSDLLEAGAKLPEYLASWLEPGAEPFLPDLARLEWARTYAYYAANPKPWDREALSKRTPDELALLRLETAPATALVESRWHIDEVRAELRASDWTPDSPRPKPPVEGKRYSVVFRDGLWPKAEVVGEAEFRLLQSAKDGLTLGVACERLAEFEDVTPDTLFQWLAKWASRNAICCR